MTRDDRLLDEAIDAIAARMVEMPGDADLAMRIVHSLPERRSRVPWLVTQLVAVSTVVLALVLWNTHERPATIVPVLQSVAVGGLGESIAALAPAPLANEPRRTQRVEPLEPLEPLVSLVPSTDFDGALPAIAGPAAIAIGELTTVALPETPSLVLAPVVIAELPMTAESFIPRQ